MRPVGLERITKVLWGPTHTGKSHTAWEEAGFEAYAKDPNSKFWCGYRSQDSVVIDEFRGKIDVSHLLRWTDRYPHYLELKGSALPSSVRRIWITSNLHPKDWWPELDYQTYLAFERRVEIIEMSEVFRFE